MGVTNRNEVHYKNPDQMSSTESLHIPISSSHASLASAVSSESIEVQTLPPRRQNRHKITFESPMSPPRNAGRRRQRRFRAVAELSALIEEEEPEVYMEEGIPHSSPFTTIVNNPEFADILEQFTAEDDEKQAKLLENNNTIPPKSKIPLVSYRNLSINVKMTFKMMRSLYELEKTEEEIVNFFSNNPESCYINGDKSSFQRLLIHGLAEYYCFKSISFDSEDGKRTIKVENPYKWRNFNEKRLCSIVQDNHNKRV